MAKDIADQLQQLLDRLKVAESNADDWFDDALQAQKWVGRLRTACRMALEDLENGDCRPYTLSVLRDVLN